MIKQTMIKKALLNTGSLKQHLKKQNINAQETRTGSTLLHYAVFNKFPEKQQNRMIEQLIIHGASPYIKNKKGERAILSPIFKRYINQVLKIHKLAPGKKVCNVYLAGPEVFLPFSLSAGNFIKAQTLLFNLYHLKKSPYHIQGIYPFDSGYVPKNLDFQDGLNIYKGDVAIMNRSRAVLANMVKFRGPGMDGGTAFEMGYMTAQKKIVVGYYDETPYFDKPQKNRAYTIKVEEEIGPLHKGPLNLTYDKNNLLVEPFEMPDNLMMVSPTLGKNNKLQIADSSWQALFVLKKRLDKLFC